jgi:hypothetical protein
MAGSEYGCNGKGKGEGRGKREEERDGNDALTVAARREGGRNKSEERRGDD